jgi:serine/threonine-protein kinase
MSTAAFAPRDWHRINRYLDEVLDLEPQARTGWLDSLSTTQPTLVQTLRAMLDEREILNSAGFLEQPLFSSMAFAAVQDAAMTGQQVGAYTIDRLLGRGGMGEVWLASRSDGRFEGQCAIKFLAAAIAQPKLVERFRYEAGLLARLGHPHIARLLDAGATHDGRQFLVLEYVDGLHIDEYCAQYELPVRARVRLFLDAVAAVAHAHSHLVVHRDLKPSNVLVTRDGTVKLLDFGVAKLLSTELAPDDGLTTRVEEIAVTPEYAAPEQLLGEMTTTATDVYQLGMLLYVLLACAHPLQSSGSRAERIRAALNGKVPRASEFAAGALRKQLRGDLDAILGKALHPNPVQRYQTAAAMRDDLGRYLNREPVSARRGARLYAIGKLVDRHRAAAAVSLVALVSLCGMLAFGLAQGRLAAKERDHALELASRNAAVTEFLGTLITEGAEADKPVTVAEMLERSEKLALADTSGSAENRAAVLQMIGERYGSLGDHTTASRLFEKGLSMLGKSTDHSLRSELTCLRATSIASLGRRDEAVKIIETELKQLDSDPWVAAYCLLYRSYIAYWDDQGEQTLRYAQQGLERFHLAPQVSATDESLFLAAVGDGFQLTGRNREADDYYRRAVRKYAEVGRESSANSITVRNSWALVAARAGAPKRALEIYDGTLRLVAEHYQGEAPPPYLVGNRARALEDIGRYQEARTAYENELQIGEQRKIIESQAHALSGLASTAQEMHDRSASARYLMRFTAVITPSIPPGAPPWKWLTIAHAKMDVDDGHFAEALAKYTQALGNSNTASNTTARLGKSEAELGVGDAAAAEKDARLALETATILQGNLPYSNITGLSWLALGRAQQKLGHAADARRAFENAERQLSNTVDDNHPALLEVRSLLAAGIAVS